MAAFAAHADAIIQCHVVAKANDLVQRGWAIANQCCAFDGIAKLAVLDQIGLGTAEHEFARHDVDLPAAKAFGEDTVFDAAQQFGRVVIAAAHECVGHARHGCMGVAFAAAIARGGNAHQAGVHAVLHISAQYAVFDQDIFLRRRAFIINRQRTTAVHHGAIVDNGHAGRGHALANLAGKGTAALAVEIAFKTMADGFMQQYARPAGAKQHGHFASGRGDRTQVGQRLRQCFINGMFPFMIFKQFVVQIAPAKTISAGFAAVAILRDDGDIQSHQGPHVRGDKAVGAHDFDDAPAARKADADLRNAWVTGAGGGVDLLAQRNLLREWHEFKRIAVCI